MDVYVLVIFIKEISGGYRITEDLTLKNTISDDLWTPSRKRT